MKQSNIIRNRKEQFIGNLEFKYDELNDLLYVYKKSSSVYSNVMIGDFHIEFNKSSELVGVEVLNASDILGEYGIPLKILRNMKKVDLKVVTAGNSLLVFMIVYSMDDQTKSATITLNHSENQIMKAIASA